MSKILNPVTDHTAPEAARPVLEAVRKAFGFVPNLLATFANSPTTLQGYTTLDGIWEKGTLTSVERQLVLLTASAENACDYCSAAHATVAKMLKADARTVSAVRTGAPIADAKLNALVALTRELVAERGHAGQHRGNVGTVGPSIHKRTVWRQILTTRASTPGRSPIGAPPAPAPRPPGCSAPA